MIEERDTKPRPRYTPVVIRPMQRTDIEAVSKIESRSYSTPWSAQAYVTEISNPAASYFVATVNQKVIGYGGLWVVMDEAHLTTLAVDPDFRGLHIGERILMEMLIHAIRLGASRATLEVRAGNDVARSLYEKYGFVWIAIRKGYYSDNNENAIVMWINDLNEAEWRKRFISHRIALGVL